MIPLRRLIHLLLPGLGALALAAPAVALAAEQSVTTPASSSAETTSTPVPAAPATPVAPPAGEAAAPAPAPAPAGQSAPEVVPAPQVQAQQAQGSTAGSSPKASHAHLKAQTPAGSGQPEPSGGSSPSTAQAKHPAPAPSALTPPLPLTFGSPISGVPGFYIESFRIPPFLLPIFQAAGSAYGIPWQVLAAINEVETDYGRDLSVSSAGAEGWMQFLPSSWETYGVDANGDGFKDPYNPADAIFAAARYLKAAGGDVDIRGAVYSYNHSQAYVASVLLRAQLLGGTPPNLLGAITGLTQARFPVHAPSHFSDGFQTVCRDHDLLPAGRARDRGSGRADPRIWPHAFAGAVRIAARLLRQHLHLCRARQRGQAVPGTGATRPWCRQPAGPAGGPLGRTGSSGPGQRGHAIPRATV